ncbi:AI-2E family transporter [Leifsonia shinshuensis]|uniref:AI-2E family transporter n=1 Tax=Leifsonia shinshuensis TaxID=150026 RepID=UPI00285711BB|nr:AI-2E family transporter [Leifsonia shinshuensis]MDR6971726.1 putative PurR-regulated permease PerM [Leifsonia shinshuensis]
MTIQNPFRLALVGTLGVGLGLLVLNTVASLSTVITWIGAALFLALGVEPLIAFLERRRVPRWLALVATLAVAIGGLVALVYAIVPVAVDQGSQLVGHVASWFESGAANEWFQGLKTQFPAIVNQQNIDALASWAQQNVPSLTTAVLQTSAAVLHGAFGVVVVAILTVYFTASLPRITRRAYQLVPASRRARVADLGDQITGSVGRFVSGQLALALINGVLSAVFLSVIGAKYPILLASIAFVFSLIPLVGTATGSVIITAVCALSGPATAIAAAIYYLVYMQVEAYVLSPRIMSRAVAVPGALVVVAALAGGALLGVLGALVAIPFAAAALLIVKQVVIPYQRGR